MPLSKDKMREYQAKRRSGKTVNPTVNLSTDLVPVSTVVNPVTLEMFEALEWRVSEIEARFAVDGVVRDAVGSRRGRSVAVGDSPEDLFKRVVAGKVARLGVR